MTLCLAWRTNEIVHFASDSRVSRELPTGVVFADVYVKIVPLQVRVFHLENCIYNYTWGMCFAGETSSVLAFKESLQQVMRNLQINPITGTLSYESLVNHITKAYSALISQLHNLFLCDDLPDFFISGYCPVDKKVKVSKLQVICDGLEPMVVNTEVLQESPSIEFLGSGSNDAKSFFSTFSDLDIVRLIDRVSKINSSVGGPVQYGIFFKHNPNFTMLGVRQKEMDPNGNLSSKFMIAGLEVMGDQAAFDIDNFVLRYSFTDID